MQLIERYTVVLYDRSSECSGVDECRRVLYTKKNRAIENIPPTANALLQHTKCAALQAHICMSCLMSTAHAYDPLNWGWTKSVDGNYEPLWCTIPDVSEYCTELVKCSCKNICRNCKCKKSQLRCTKLCACEGQCDRQTAKDCTNDDVVWQDVEEDTEVDNVLDILFHDWE